MNSTYCMRDKTFPTVLWLHQLLLVSNEKYEPITSKVPTISRKIYSTTKSCSNAPERYDEPRDEMWNFCLPSFIPSYLAAFQSTATAQQWSNFLLNSHPHTQKLKGCDKHPFRGEIKDLAGFARAAFLRTRVRPFLQRPTEPIRIRYFVSRG